MLTLLFIVILACGAWFWFEAMKTKEAALQAAKHYCKTQGLQLLDDTVACKKVKLKTQRGRFYFERLYQATVYDREADKKQVLPIVLHNRHVQSVGHAGKRVVSLSDYRDQ